MINTVEHQHNLESNVFKVDEWVCLNASIMYFPIQFVFPNFSHEDWRVDVYFISTVTPMKADFCFII